VTVRKPGAKKPPTSRKALRRTIQAPSGKNTAGAPLRIPASRPSRNQSKEWTMPSDSPSAKWLVNVAADNAQTRALLERRPQTLGGPR
jgi:hypothetical protein